MRSLQAKTVLAATAVAVLASLAAVPAQAETKLLFNRFVPVKHPFNTGMFEPWAQDVEKATEGRVKVEFSAANLAPPPKQWNMVSKGIADVAMLANIFERNRLQLPPIAQLPFMGNSSEKRGVAMWRTHEKYLAKANEYKGMHLLGQWSLSGSNLYHTKKQIRSLADLKNEKMWVIAGTPNKMISGLGAVVVSVPGVKMFNVVSKKVVDGTVTSTYTLAAFKLMPYIKHVTLVPGGLYATTFSLLLNEKKWKKLSKADKAAVASVSGERIAANAGRATDNLNAKVQGLAEKKGITFETASASFMREMRDGLAAYEGEWVKKANARGIDGAAALAYFKTQVK